MIGAIAGDIIGSSYEGHAWRGAWQELPLFPPRSRFTDDTVMTIALAKAIMEYSIGGGNFGSIVIDKFHEYGHRYPRAGYGGQFRKWLQYRYRDPYNSFGNGSAMRVSPVGQAFATIEETEKMAAMSAAVTHNHPEGIKGAQAVAAAIFMARNGAPKKDIRNYVSSRFGYNLARTLAEIRPGYKFDVTCQGSVPEAIIAFLESDDYEQAVRKAIWLGGDADTQAAIAGSIAGAMYGVPEEIAKEALSRLDEGLYDDCLAWQAWLGGRN